MVEKAKLEALSRKRLQSVAKKYGIAANLRSSVIVEELSCLWDKHPHFDQAPGIAGENDVCIEQVPRQAPQQSGITRKALEVLSENVHPELYTSNMPDQHTKNKPRRSNVQAPTRTAATRNSANHAALPPLTRCESPPLEHVPLDMTPTFPMDATSTPDLLLSVLNRPEPAASNNDAHTQQTSKHSSRAASRRPSFSITDALFPDVVLAGRAENSSPPSLNSTQILVPNPAGGSRPRSRRVSEINDEGFRRAGDINDDTLFPDVVLAGRDPSRPSSSKHEHQSRAPSRPDSATGTVAAQMQHGPRAPPQVPAGALEPPQFPEILEAHVPNPMEATDTLSSTGQLFVALAAGRVAQPHSSGQAAAAARHAAAAASRNPSLKNLADSLFQEGTEVPNAPPQAAPQPPMSTKRATGKAEEEAAQRKSATASPQPASRSAVVKGSATAAGRGPSASVAAAAPEPTPVPAPATPVAAPAAKSRPASAAGIAGIAALPRPLSAKGIAGIAGIAGMAAAATAAANKAAAAAAAATEAGPPKQPSSSRSTPVSCPSATPSSGNTTQANTPAASRMQSVTKTAAAAAAGGSGKGITPGTVTPTKAKPDLATPSRRDVPSKPPSASKSVTVGAPLGIPAGMAAAIAAAATAKSVDSARPRSPPPPPPPSNPELAWEPPGDLLEAAMEAHDSDTEPAAAAHPHSDQFQKLVRRLQSLQIAKRQEQLRAQATRLGVNLGGIISLNPLNLTASGSLMPPPAHSPPLFVSDSEDDGEQDVRKAKPGARAASQPRAGPALVLDRNDTLERDASVSNRNVHFGGAPSPRTGSRPVSSGGIPSYQANPVGARTRRRMSASADLPMGAILEKEAAAEAARAPPRRPASRLSMSTVEPINMAKAARAARSTLMLTTGGSVRGALVTKPRINGGGALGAVPEGSPTLTDTINRVTASIKTYKPAPNRSPSPTRQQFTNDIRQGTDDTSEDSQSAGLGRASRASRGGDAEEYGAGAVGRLGRTLPSRGSKDSRPLSPHKMLMAGGGIGGGGSHAPLGGPRSASTVKYDVAEAKRLEMIVETKLRTKDLSDCNWDKVAGAEAAKEALGRAADEFTDSAMLGGAASPSCPHGVLVFGPPGAGKKLLVRAMANQLGLATYWVSSKELTTLHAEHAAMLLRAVFRVALRQAPALIIIDEVDRILRGPLLTTVSLQRCKAELQQQIESLVTAGPDGGAAHVLVAVTTSLPFELEDGLLAHFDTRVHVPLPDEDTREMLVFSLMVQVNAALTARDVDLLARKTAGLSSSDIVQLCKKAVEVAKKQFTSARSSAKGAGEPLVTVADFEHALEILKSVQGKSTKSGGVDLATANEAWSLEQALLQI